MRQDLLMLTEEDLATISNRGNVNRAKKDLAKESTRVDIEELDGEGLRFVWSDEVVCEFAEHVVVKDADCSCPP